MTYAHGRVKIVNINIFFFKQRQILYVLLAVLELWYVDQAGLEHRSVCLCLLSAGIEGVACAGAPGPSEEHDSDQDR